METANSSIDLLFLAKGVEELQTEPWTSFIYGRNCCHFFLVICPHEAGTWDPNYTLGVDFLVHDFFIILKNSHQDLSNEGLNFTLSPVEIGH